MKRSYLGDVTTYKVRLVQNGTELTIKLQNKFIQRQIRKGDKAWIGWEAGDSCIV